MISSKILYAVIFLYSVQICSMDPKPEVKSQKDWISAARGAIKADLAPDLEQAMKHIEDQKVKKHLFRKIAREKPDKLPLLEAALKSGLELQALFDQETLVEFVERKDIAAHMALVKKYLTLQELDQQITPPSSPKRVSITEPVAKIENKPADATNIAAGKTPSARQLSLSRSGKISRRSIKNGNPIP